MVDILLDKTGDIKVSKTGEITVTESVNQAVKIHLKWMLGEWRLGDRLGFPWIEDILVKNPDLSRVKMLVRNEIMSTEGVVDANVTYINYDPANRTVSIQYTVQVGEEVYREEVILNGGIWRN